MILEKTIRFIVLSALFLLLLIPFLVPQSLFFPFITGKNFAFRILIEIMAGGWLALALTYPKYRPRRSWILAAFSVFVVIIALADALGAYPFKSFWSNYERMDGWVTLAHLFVLVVVASSMLNTEKLWGTFWKSALGVSVAVAGYGFLQLFGVASLTAGFSSLSRLDATFGNPIYLAAYMLFHVFIAALLWAQAWTKSAPGSRLGFSIAYGTVLVIDCIVLLLTSTRGTILGLVGGVFISAVLVALFARDAKNSLVRPAVGVVIGLVVLSGGFFLVRDAAWVQNVSFLQRLGTISASDSTTKARFYNWGMAWEGVKERPVLGWGQENYAVVFDKYYDPRMYNAEQWFDRVHNVVFDWLVAGGILGLLGYLSIFAAALAALWHRSRGAQNLSEFTVVESSILSGVLSGYFFHNLFVFDNVTSYMLFGLIIAYIVWRKSESAGSLRLWAQSLPVTSLPYVAIAAALLTWGGAYWINAAALEQNRLLIQAISPQAEGVGKNLELIKSAIAEGSVGTQEAREQLLQMTTKIISASGIDPSIKQQFYDVAVAEMKKQQEASPLDARPALFLGLLHNAAGNYVAGAEALLHAHELSPAKQSILYEMAQNAQMRGDVAGMMRNLKTAYELYTDNPQARILYAAALIRTGNNALADELLATIIPTGEAADPRITSAYLEHKRYDKIAPIWSAYVAVHPDNVQGYFTLAAAYYGMGERTKAIEVLVAASKLSPAVAAQAAPFIEQIKNGTLKLE
ncbi:O-antigen ligase family protein [Candidatus Kaiserbacteria bacterium]|nr:O-antigen ligase family protein [Candidatus Kaiserbacteria bacterium]